VLLLVTLYSSVSLALATTDGVLDVERFGTPVHVESDGRADCVPHHDHAICQVVRSATLGAPSSAPDEVASAQPSGSLVAAPAADPPLPSNDRLRGSPGPRAPPAT